MPERRQRSLRVVCIVLGAVFALQLALFVVHASFSRGLSVPALPSLPPQSDGQAPTNSPSAKAVAKSGTNAPGTNASAKINTNSPGTNSVAQSGKSKTNAVVAKTIETNATAPSAETATTNAAPFKELSEQQTNLLSPKMTGTNATNVIAAASSKDKTNSAATKTASKKNGSPPGRPGAPGKAAELPAAVKERVDRIVQGEILAPVMRPMPMALLGIAGQSAFLRSPDGQTGLVKEGDQLGTLKLLRIGTNRVLVEQDGEKKELMMFAGLGSESLLPKPDKTTNEPSKKSPRTIP